ncbi:MAG: purine-binding chemotaxis protein CheW [Spirochaetes bacterium]|nr:purine-binding chemotaxis protein CheW [Spirochaetota bacterium]
MNTVSLHDATEVKKDGPVQQDSQYVTFIIADENYGVEVLKVQEIIGMTEIVFVPNSPDFMKGVINLRGSVVPVVDMRKRFHMEERQYDMFTVIIIVEIRKMLVGMIVDSVSDVVGIPRAGIHETPHFTARIDTEFIAGIGQVNDKLVIILDIDEIFSAEEMKTMEQEESV